jgi:hypothetical protein
VGAVLDRPWSTQHQHLLVQASSEALKGKMLPLQRARGDKEVVKSHHPHGRDKNPPTAPSLPGLTHRDVLIL